MEIREAYRILGASEKESLDEIRKKYYTLAKIYHPDNYKGIGKDEKSKSLNLAFEKIKSNRKSHKSNSIKKDKDRHTPTNVENEKEIEKNIVKLRNSRKFLEMEYKKDTFFQNLTFGEWLKVKVLFQIYAEKLMTNRYTLEKEYINNNVWKDISLEEWLEKIVFVNVYAKKLGTTRNHLIYEYQRDNYFNYLEIEIWLKTMDLLRLYAKRLRTTSYMLKKEYIEDIYLNHLSIFDWLDVMDILDQYAKKLGLTRKKIVEFLIDVNTNIGMEKISSWFDKQNKNNQEEYKKK